MTVKLNDNPSQTKESTLKQKMPLSIKKQLAIALNRTTHQTKGIASPNIMINGVPHSTAFAKNRMNISLATAALSNMGILQNQTINQKTNVLSENFLSAIGVSIVDSERGFSLMSHRPQETILDPEQEENFGNPNIMDSKQYAFLRNENIQAIESFPNSADPFYQLDSALTTTQAAVFYRNLNIQKNQDIIKVSSHVSQVNLINIKDSKKLKYFNSLESRIQQRRSRM